MPPARLRVGDQQLIEIAKALSLAAEILIMDEPTSALTETEVARLYRVIAGSRERGVTILYISHKLDEVFRLADRITVLRDGKLVEDAGEIRNQSARNRCPLMVGREIEETHTRPRPHRRRNRARSQTTFAPLARPCPEMAAQRNQFLAQARRNPGHRRPDGSRPHRASRMPLRRQPQPPQGEILLAGKPVRFAHPAEARPPAWRS